MFLEATPHIPLEFDRGYSTDNSATREGRPAHAELRSDER